MELTFFQVMQFNYLRRQREAEDAFWKMRLKQFTMTAYTAPGILNEVEQPLATEDTTTIEQESFEPYPVINTLDTKPTHNMEDPRVLTFGEKATGVSFNPSKDPNVDEVKALYAQIIDKLNTMRADPNKRGEAARYFSTAITNAEISQMLAVKAITWQW